MKYWNEIGNEISNEVYRNSRAELRWNPKKLNVEETCNDQATRDKTEVCGVRRICRSRALKDSKEFVEAELRRIPKNLAGEASAKWRLLACM